jgi:hypothetical protein
MNGSIRRVVKHLQKSLLNRATLYAVENPLLKKITTFS